MLANLRLMDRLEHLAGHPSRLPPTRRHLFRQCAKRIAELFSAACVSRHRVSEVRIERGDQEAFCRFDHIDGVTGFEMKPVSYTHLRAHETGRKLVCRLLLEKKKS